MTTIGVYRPAIKKRCSEDEKQSFCGHNTRKHASCQGITEPRHRRKTTEENHPSVEKNWTIAVHQ
jgi:hypothetical protein